MNHTSRSLLTTLLATAAMALAACGQPAASATPQPTAAPTATPQPTPAPQPTTAPQPTPAPQPTAAPQPTSPPAATTGGDLSLAEMRTIFEASCTAYPWRWKQTVVNKETNQTIAGRLEAQSGTRVHTVTLLGEQNAVIESILISPTLYLKATGAPAEKLKEFGAAEDQWYKVPPGSPLAGFARMVYLAGNPPKLLEAIGFGEELQRLAAGGEPYKRTGTETIGGTQTNVYELTVSGDNGPVTYRVSVGASDRRIYKMVSDTAKLTATTVVEYDPSITIEPPAP
jgi:hypothetical protein